LLQFCNYCNAFNLTIVHNNDFHTHFAPININSIPCKIGVEECYGGAARTVSMVSL
jgi:2',3'-cyclic-nucleotide 2'-phosphodiesterase (5'-nucleotidase family)